MTTQISIFLGAYTDPASPALSKVSGNEFEPVSWAIKAAWNKKRQ